MKYQQKNKGAGTRPPLIGFAIAMGLALTCWSSAAMAVDFSLGVAMPPTVKGDANSDLGSVSTTKGRVLPPNEGAGSGGPASQAVDDVNTSLGEVSTTRGRVLPPNEGAGSGGPASQAIGDENTALGSVSTLDILLPSLSTGDENTALGSVSTTKGRVLSPDKGAGSGGPASQAVEGGFAPLKPAEFSKAAQPSNDGPKDGPVGGFGSGGPGSPGSGPDLGSMGGGMNPGMIPGGLGGPGGPGAMGGAGGPGAGGVGRP